MALRALLVVLFALALAMGACGPTTTGDEGGQDSGPGWTTDGPRSGDGGEIDQPPPDNCSDAAKLIYVVDEDNRFSSFTPHPTPMFNDLGVLNCPATPGPLGIPATPFSMSVDRDAIAWVLYSNGELLRVETANPGNCTKANFQVNQQGFLLMGMGFVADNPGSTLDTLYVAGGTGPGAGTGATLGTIDMDTFVLTPIGPVSGWPELTGTGDAKLWGFYPDTTPPKVSEIAKASGQEGTTWALPTLQGEPRAWAFAFWGGDFWIFLMRQGELDTTVYHVKGTDGSMEVALAGTGRVIVGAGVSTCAPIVID